MRMETQQDSPEDLAQSAQVMAQQPQHQAALVAIQALEQEQLPQDTEERKHLHNQTFQKFKEIS